MARPDYLYTRAPRVSGRILIACALVTGAVLVSAVSAITSKAVAAGSPSCTTAPHLTSTYIPPYFASSWDGARWGQETSELQADCFNSMIIQYSGDAGQMASFYPTTMSGWTDTSPNDVIGDALAAADQAGMKVTVGLTLNQKWFTVHADPTFLSQQAQYDNAMASDLWARYSSHQSFAGWYLPLEMDSANFQTQSDWANMVTYYTSVIDHLHALSPGLPITVAPFYQAAAAGAGGQTPAQWQAMWTYILSRVPIDVVAVQDGEGDPGSVDGSLGSPQVSGSQMAQWFSATKQAITAAGATTQLWDDVELYSPLDGRSLATSQVVSDMGATAPYVSTFTSFSYPSQLDPLYLGSTLFDSAYHYYATTGSVPPWSVDPPAGLQAGALSDHSVRLTWSTPASSDGVAGYFISRNGVLLAVVRGGANTAITDTGVTAGSGVGYQVAAFDAAGDLSSPASVSTTVPAQPGSVDLAARQPYQSSVPAASQYPDQGYKLTNGQVGSASYTDPSWQGRLTTSPYSFTLDLGRSAVINQVSLQGLAQPGVGIYLPDSVAVATSPDGTTWSNFGAPIAKPMEPAGTVLGTFVASASQGVQARWIRVTVTPASWTTTWTFLDSLQVDQWTAPSPASSSGVRANAVTTGRPGYRLASAGGHVSSFGLSGDGSVPGRLARPVVGITSTLDRQGYWLTATDGGIFAFGDARFFGSTGGVRLSRPVVGMAATPDGKGYWFVAADGGVFAFGDAAFYGSGAGVGAVAITP